MTPLQAGTRALAFLVMAATAAPVTAQTIEEKAAVCDSCHGETGRPQDPEIPVIWGQREGYIYLQLRDYKRGTRANEVMSAIVADLSRDDMLKLAAYFANKTWPRAQHRSDPKSPAAAERAATAGACTECHLSGYLGAGTNPRLAGQQFEYLLKTMHAFQTRERANNPLMSDLLKSYSEEDIRALADYLAGL